MSISGIISVSGKPGLYKVVTQTKNGLIAESLEDQKRIPVYATQKVSALEEISIYTLEEDMPLADIFEMMYKKTEGKKAIDHKSKPEELRNFFMEVVENYDQERVYNSDLKKLFQWFNILIDNGLLKPEKKKADKKEANKDDGKEAPKKAAPKKSTTAKKKAAAAKKPMPKTSGAKSSVKSTPRKVGGGK